MGGIYAVLAVVQLVAEARRSGPEGRRRLLELEPARLRGVVDGYRGRWLGWVLATWAVSRAVVTVAGAVDGAWLQAATSATVSAALTVTLVLRRRNRPLVLAATAHLDLAPPAIAPRDTSATRARRMRQLGLLTVGALLLAPVALTLAELTSRPASLVLGTAGVALLVLVLVGGLAFAWASAWVYGDEEPASAQRVG